MFKPTLLILLVLTLLVSCLPKTQVLEGNVFQSGTPSLHIKVNPKIAFQGMTETSAMNLGTFDSHASIAPSRHAVYYFGEPGNNNKLGRLFIIHLSRITELNWTYIDQFNKWWKDAPALDKVKIDGKQYNRAAMIGSLKGGDFAQYFNSKSLFLADCYAIYVLNRIHGQNRMVTMWYAETCDQLSQRIDGFEMGDDRQVDIMLRALDESFSDALSF
jgi:hypothetical protein